MNIAARQNQQEPINDLPKPLVPAYVDLRDFPFMKLDVRRLLSSDTWIEAADDPKVGHALMTLWCESWHQVPAASVPDNDKVLARLSMCDATTWQEIKPRVMKSWRKCSDGRFYHHVVAEKALEAWGSKVAQRERTKAATEARLAKSGSNPRNSTSRHRDDNVTSTSRPTSRQRHERNMSDVTFTKREGEGDRDREGEEEDSLVPPAPANEDQGRHQKKAPSRTDHPSFAAFWAAYPSRGEATNPRKPASEKFTAAVNQGIDPDSIIRGTKGYADHCRRSGKLGTDKVKQAITFLNQQVWDQYLEPGNGHAPNGGMPLWKTDPSAWNDTRQPPPWDDAPLGTRAGTWLMTSSGWQVER